MIAKNLKNWQKGLVVGLILFFIFAIYMGVKITRFHTGFCVRDINFLEIDASDRVYECGSWEYALTQVIQPNLKTFGPAILSIPLVLLIGPVIIGSVLDKIKYRNKDGNS